MTDSEQILWEILQNNQFMNTKRRRQHPFHDYILDFCNTDYKIIIEVDWGIHTTKEQQEHDKIRDEYLQWKWFTVLRFSNDQVYNDLENILSTLKNIITNSSLPQGGLGGQQGIGVRLIYDLIKEFISKLPFELTHAQKKVIKEMLDDIIQDDDPSGFATFPTREGQRKMMRLLQWDVWSGKTIVAAAIAYVIIKYYHKQVVFLAPLSILAQQHYASLAKLFLPLGITVDLLSGSRTKGHKDHLKQKTKIWQVDIIVATHAVLQEDVGFADLWLVVIDEQHKFGVRQRAFFAQHGYPHIIQMSATPIPRSMALAFFGEFDVSIIDELPAGRKTIQTKIMTASDYQKLIPWTYDRIQHGEKLFVVVPLIEESEKLDLHNAMDVYQEIQDLFQRFWTDAPRVGLIHGRMTAKEKDTIMTDFSQGTLHILVSTTVIEVGVDIREATMMIIKNAERFWLAQLHQLRGRIGRNNLQSYCFLETKTKSGDSYMRLKAMEETSDGFKLAEIDLKTRGAGEILGTRQSGEADIPPEIIGDLRFIQMVRAGAEWILDYYPHLEWLPGLKKFVEQKMGDMIA